MIFYFLLFISSGLAVVCSDSYHRNNHNHENPIVTTPLGKIQGSLLTSRNGRLIFTFRGIRYAQAPINELRFKPPKPVKKWNGIYDATEDGPVCPQPAPTDPVSEDCLVLNVYSTKLPESNRNPRRPVLIYIHAGGFSQVSGRSTSAGPKYLTDHDIVLVTINYRLGSLGFLSTGDKEAPGNNGFKDQVLALKWVKQNIAAFGGDPDSVTIMGYSAGGISVTAHMISPMSRGLFHKAIAMSDSTLAAWPIPTNQLDLAKKQARLVGCPDNSSRNIINCLKTKRASEIADTLFQFSEIGQEPALLWRPVIEGDFGQERFLTEHPIKSVQEGKFQKVPFMSGITTDEFAGRAFDLINNQEALDQLNGNWEKYAPIIFLYERNTQNSKTISKSLKKFYFDNKPIDNSSFPDLIKIYADSLVAFSVNRAVKLISEKSSAPVYYYRFNYKGRYSNFHFPGTNGTAPYAVHHDDLIYLFSSDIIFERSDDESSVVDQMTLMWTNFAITGKPIPEVTDKLDNVKWDPYNLRTQKYLVIDKKLSNDEKLFEKRYQEWEKLFPLN